MPKERSDAMEVLAKAIEKAIAGGFSFQQVWSAIEPSWKWEILDGDGDIAFYADTISPNPWRMSFETLIFNHDFARALWGESPVLMDIQRVPLAHPIYTDAETIEGYEVPHWQYHLMQMVIADDPIKYLEENM